MPIRTHRGRAAVYRRFWGWPLRSPKHLAVAVVGFAVIATVVGLALPSAPASRTRTEIHNGSSQRSYPERPPQQVVTDSSPPTFSVPQTPPPPAPPNPAGLAAVEAWGRQWVNHPPGITGQQWLAGLRPYTTDEYLTVMSSIDPANVPATAITARATATASTASSMQVRLPTNAGDIQVLVVSTPQGWRVAGYNKVG